MRNWIRVNKQHRCPICKHDTWCMIAKDDGAILCMRTESPKSLELVSGETGWIHQQGSEVATRRREVYAPEPVSGFLDIDAILRRWSMDTFPAEISRLGEMLGVSARSLTWLGVAWSKQHNAWAFPMRDGAGKAVGIRLRAEDGAKWAVTGSHQGLFIPSYISGDGPLLMPEGPTDTAALMDLGFDVIGRPSCSGGVREIRAYLKGHRRDVVIVADADKADKNGVKAGERGAESLAAALTEAKSVKIIYPLKGKDARQWKSLGATSGLIKAVIANTRFVPQRKAITAN